MMRRLVQIILLVSLLAGTASQALSCSSMPEDSHPCCRALATIKATAQPHTTTKTQPTSFRGGSCGCTSAPVTPIEKPIGSFTVHQTPTSLTSADEVVLTVFVREEFQRPLRLQAPNHYSPPHFILYSSLLI